MITRNKMSLFSRQPLRSSSESKQSVTSLKNDCALFSRLYTTIQTLGVELDNFFERKNHEYPVLLSLDLDLHGKLRFVKTYLLEYLEKWCKTCGEAPLVNVIILDGTAALLLSTCWNPLMWRHSKNMHHIMCNFLTSHRTYEMYMKLFWDIYLERYICLYYSLNSTAMKNVESALRLPDN